MYDKITSLSQQDLREKIRDLRVEHRNLDLSIINYEQDPALDHLVIRRLKKRKLLIKDTINVLRSQLIPDLNA